MCRSRRELSNEYLFAKIGVDTAENELRVDPNRVRVIARNSTRKYASKTVTRIAHSQVLAATIEKKTADKGALNADIQSMNEEISQVWTVKKCNADRC